MKQKKLKSESDIARDKHKALLKRWRDNPVAFARERILVKDIEPEQVEILNCVSKNSRVVVRSGHGIGKTTVLSFIAFWWLFTRPKSIVVCTAPTTHQLRDVLWREHKKWAELSGLNKMLIIIETRIDMKGHRGEWSMFARACKEPESLAGFHDKYLMYIIDEASGVPVSIGETIEGALTEENNKLVMVGNPTQLSGMFYDAFNTNAASYKTLHFNSENSRRVSRHYIDTMKKRYGEESDVYRVRVRGDFPKGQPDSFISLSLCESAKMRELDPGEDVIIGVDPARYGDDESVICYRRGLKVYPLIVFTGMNTVRLAREVIKIVSEFRRMKIKGTIIVRVDDTGLGAGVTDNLQEQESELDMIVVPVNNGSTPYTPDGQKEYSNLGAQIWGEAKTMLEVCQIPEDSELTAQLCTRRYSLDAMGRIRLEKKEDMKKRQLTSPDRADAFALCMTSYEISSFVEGEYTVDATEYLNDSSRY